MGDFILFNCFITVCVSLIGLCGYITLYYKNAVYAKQTELYDLIQNKVDTLNDEKRILDESSSKMTLLTVLSKAFSSSLQKLETLLTEKNQCRGGVEVKDRFVVGDDDEIDEHEVEVTGSGSGFELDDKKMKMKKKKKKKKKRRRVKKKVVVNGDEEKCGSVDVREEDLVWKYPFTTCSSPMQIKQQVDQLMKCRDSKKMSLTQIGQFADCLTQAKDELHNKSEAVNRKFTITKALLFRADRSSHDLLSRQKLDTERKQLEDGALVHNMLQHQLNLSTSYKKMLEASACLDKSKDKPEDYLKSEDSEFPYISFEEYLAKEKKDPFWQRNGKVRSNSS